MRHAKQGQESLKNLKTIIPRKYVYEGKTYLQFSDILYNLVLNNLRALDYDSVTKKVHTATTQPLSPRHRRRLEKQFKKAMPRKV